MHDGASLVRCEVERVVVRRDAPWAKVLVEGAVVRVGGRGAAPAGPEDDDACRRASDGVKTRLPVIAGATERNGAGGSRRSDEIAEAREDAWRHERAVLLLRVVDQQRHAPRPVAETPRAREVEPSLSAASAADPKILHAVERVPPARWRREWPAVDHHWPRIESAALAETRLGDEALLLAPGKERTEAALVQKVQEVVLGEAQRRGEMHDVGEHAVKTRICSVCITLDRARTPQPGCFLRNVNSQVSHTR